MSAQAANNNLVGTPTLPLAETGFSLKLPKAETVRYRGVVSFDAAQGPSAGIVYPAIGGITSVIIGLAAHGAIVEAGKSEAKSKIQQDADKVLDPYRDVLARFTNQELAQRSLRSLSGLRVNAEIEPGKAGEGWIVESLPVFSMTQDRKALVLENQLAIYAANAPDAIRYQNVVKVVSDVHNAPDAQAFWGAEDGRHLKAESASLFAQSLKLLVEATGRATVKEGGAEKTFRYTEGSDQKIERAQLLSESCGRAVIRTLRGWLMSVPTRKLTEASSSDCADSEPYQG